MAKITQTSDRKEVQITCRAPDAQRIYVAGTFNDWSTTATPLSDHEAGPWTVDLQLLPGHYEFKLVVDGAWCCEPGCDHEYRGCPKCAPNDAGTMNRILDVN